MSKYIKFINQFKMYVIFPLMPLVVLYGIATNDYWYLIVICGIIMFYPIMSVGQGIGYHKMFSHKAFKPKKWFPYLSAFIGSISFSGGPLGYALLHRIHHKHVDTELDPHSPMHGRIHAYIGWLINYTPPENERYIVIDLVRQYPWLVAYSKYEWLVFLTFHTSMFLLSPTLFLIIMMACLLSMNNSLIVNAFSHDASSEGWSAKDKIWLAKCIGPIFLHKQHHDDAGKWDYSDGQFKDATRWFIKNWFAEDPNKVK
jgi:stearoyl-CoA desaturase (delta-9 desaturase)